MLSDQFSAVNSVFRPARCSSSRLTNRCCTTLVRRPRASCQVNRRMSVPCFISSSRWWSWTPDCCMSNQGPPAIRNSSGSQLGTLTRSSFSTCRPAISLVNRL